MLTIGQNSLEVAKEIIKSNPEIAEVTLIAHEVGTNWRVLNQALSQKLKNLLESFSSSDAIAEKTYTRKEFCNLTVNALEKLGSHIVWSLSSKVGCVDGIYRHIPMMNFHPEDLLITREDIKMVVRAAARGKSGAILDSGRYLHYYGNFLLSEEDWLKMLGTFLMPCVFVSPRYVGHVLRRGYATLRLTADETYKPKVPEVLEVIDRIDI